MKKRILIPYATYGSGHKSIAEYIKKYFEENGDYECLTLDLITDSSYIVSKFSKKTTEFFMTKLPSIWSLLYYGFDNKISAYISGKINLNLYDNKKLKKIITDFNPDITIATHFFGTDLINKYNKLNLTNSKLVTVITDYQSHDFWLNSIKGTDAIIVSSLNERIKLLKRGFKNKQIHTSGIPILSDLTPLENKNDILKKLNLDTNKKTVLFFVGGGNGALLNLTYFKHILKNDYDCNLIFIAGKNKKAEKRAKEMLNEYKRKNTKIYGFVTNVSELYKISDIVITKPGGAQTTECLLFNKPMILIKSNGGQEIGNRRFLVSNGFAKWARNKKSFASSLNTLLKNNKELEKMKKKINKYDEKKSMEKLFKIVEKI